jgi:hypothetical protein
MQANDMEEFNKMIARNWPKAQEFFATGDSPLTHVARSHKIRTNGTCRRAMCSGCEECRGVA